MPWLEHAIAYVFAVFAGALLIRLVDRALAPSTSEETQSTLLGMIERILYVASLQFGRPGFIAVWIIVKALGQWRAAGDRALAYERWLITNALSILFAGVGYLMFVAMREHYMWTTAFLLSSILAAFTLAVWMWLARRHYVRVAALLVALLLTVALAALAGR